MEQRAVLSPDDEFVALIKKLVVEDLSEALCDHIDELLWRYRHGARLRAAEDVIDHLLDLRNIASLEARVAAVPETPEELVIVETAPKRRRRRS